MKKPMVYNENQMEPRAIIKFAINNIFFNIACKLKKIPNLYSTVYWVSCGSQKFSKPQYKGTTKTTYIANYAMGNTAAKKIKILKFNNPITLIVKGIGQYFKAFIKAFKINYKKKFNLMDLTPVSLNGCRFAKRKRT